MKNLSLILILLISFSLFAQERTEYDLFQLKNLTGVEQVGVYVWELNKSLEGTGLTEEYLQAAAEEHLEEYGLKVIPYWDASRLRGGAYLEVQVSTAKADNSDVHAAVLIARFLQDVILERDRSIVHYSAITWERDTVTVNTGDNIRMEVYENLKSMLKEFSEEYKFANSPAMKKPQKKPKK